MQKTFRSFIKNGKERKNIEFFWKEWVPNPAFQAQPDCESAGVVRFLLMKCLYF